MSKNAKIVLIVSVSLLALVAATIAAIITLPLVKEAFEIWNMDRAYKANWGFELVKGTKPLYDAPTEPLTRYMRFIFPTNTTTAKPSIMTIRSISSPSTAGST